MVPVTVGKCFARSGSLRATYDHGKCREVLEDYFLFRTPPIHSHAWFSFPKRDPSLSLFLEQLLEMVSFEEQSLTLAGKVMLKTIKGETYIYIYIYTGIFFHGGWAGRFACGV